MAFKKKFDVGTDGSLFFVTFFGERTGQVYNTRDLCQLEVDRLYLASKKTTKKSK